MKKDIRASFRDSSLDRARPKRHFLRTFVNDTMKQKRLHSNAGLVEDRTNPAAVLRIILGLVIIHLLVIGGVMLRGNIVRNHGGTAMAPTITPPPAAPAAPAAPAVQETPQPAPLNLTQSVQPAPQPAPAEPQQNHISQTAPSLGNSPANPEPLRITHAEIAPAPAAEPAPAPAPAPAVAQPAPAAEPAQGTVTLPYHTKSGDTWGRIAAQYGISVDALKAANPDSAARPNPSSGSYLAIPVPANSPAVKEAQAAKEQPAAQPQDAPTIIIHKVAPRESLGRIAAKYKVSLKKVMKDNNMTKKQADQLKIGQEIKIIK